MSRPSLVPSLLGLALLAACMPALAQNGRNAPEACPAEAREATDIPDQDPERSRAATLRAKYTAWPTTVSSSDSAKAPQPGSGGGGSDGEGDVPRGLNSKWHSFLPGMFR